MRQANPMMYEQYDKFIKHLWEEDKKLQIQKQEAIEALEKEKEILRIKEQEVNVLEKHKEKQREAYLEEEKAQELRQFSEIGVQRFFIQAREKEEEEAELSRIIQETEFEME